MGIGISPEGRIYIALDIYKFGGRLQSNIAQKQKYLGLGISNERGFSAESSLQSISSIFLLWLNVILTR